MIDKNTLENNVVNKTKGHLKIFFGYSSGVGKTYAMLKAARFERKHLKDVVIGYVDAHKQWDTNVLVKLFEELPLLNLSNGTEFNLDLALKRNPDLILLDDISHTNVTGCRHQKRYQDIEELLQAGIDVYTTLNVSNIESLNDLVASITGDVEESTIPDSVFDFAQQVKIVDMEPLELLESMKSKRNATGGELEWGKEYSMEQLVALRELAMRRLADRVKKLSDDLRIKSGKSYSTEEHILVCLSSSPTNAKIIRTAARMAEAYNGRFTALFVETPDFASMSQLDKQRLRTNVRLAEQLGATIETVAGSDVYIQISEFARLSGVTNIVLGRTNVSKTSSFFKSSLSEKLYFLSPDIDIHIIPDRDATRHKQGISILKKNFGFDLLKGILVFLSTVLVAWFFWISPLHNENITTVFVFGCLVNAIILKNSIISIFYACVNVIAFNLFFTSPYLNINFNQKFLVSYILIILVSIIASTLSTRLRKNTLLAAANTFRTQILFETNQLLQKAKDKQDIINISAEQLRKLLKRTIVFYIPIENDLIPKVFAHESETTESILINETEQSAAFWVFKNNKHAGATTSTLNKAKCLYLAVRINNKVFGVVGIEIKNKPLDSFENSVVLSMLGETALALENEQSLKERETAAILAKNEQLRANLLRSISHDLRTPLTTISGNAGILLSKGKYLDDSKKQQLYSDIQSDSQWLIGLVENLLSVSRIEDGKMQLNKNTELIDEIIQEALNRVAKNLHGRTIKFDEPKEFFIVEVDAKLIVQVMVNLIENAIKYTPEKSDIIISVSSKEGFVNVSVSDNGPGIFEFEKKKIFEMFYTTNKKIADSRRSLGLGLALCKSIIQAHSGEIFVRDNNPKGSVFTFTLPIKEIDLNE